MDDQYSPRKSLTLKEQEVQFDALKKENFSLKLRVHFLEESLSRLDNAQLLEEFVELQMKYETLLKDQKNVPNESGNDILMEQIQNYRKTCEQLEDELAQAKSEMFTQQSLLSQRAIEMEKLLHENESLKQQQQQQNLMSRNNSFLSYDDDLSTKVIHNHQLEQGISMLRDQIADLKLQLIEKTNVATQMKHEVDHSRQMNQRSLHSMQEQWKRDEQGYKTTINELKEQVQRAKNENFELSKQYETIQRTHHADQTHLSMELQNIERQLQVKSEKLSEALQQVDKLSGQVKTLESTLTLKKSHIDQLTRQLDSKTSLVQTAEKDHVRVMTQLHDKVAHLQQQLNEATVAVQTKETEAQLLKEQLERQRTNIASIEERWSKQSHDLMQQHRQVRQELEQQIHQFKTKTLQLTQELQEKDSETKEIKSQMEMHSIGLEEQLRSHSIEKERLRSDLHKSQREIENLQKELGKWSLRLTEMDLAYKESIQTNDRLQSTIDTLQDRQRKLTSEFSEKQHVIQQREAELREKSQLILDLSNKINSSETMLIEGQQIVSVIEERFNQQLSERNTLLVRIQQELSRFLSQHNLPSVSADPSDNFFVFADAIADLLHSLQRIPKILEHKIKHTEERLTNDFQSLNSRLDRKLSQLERFESVVRQAVAVQKRMRESIKLKQTEIHDLKITNQEFENQVQLLKHQLSTCQSETAIHKSSDRAKFMELSTNIQELERQLKDKDRKLKESQMKIDELEDGMLKQNQGVANRVSELTNHVRILRQELDVAQKQNHQLESLLHSDNKVKSGDSMHSLLVTSEAALEKLRKQYSTEVATLRSQLEREKDRRKEADDLILSLKRELERIKRKLERREQMIELALSKLALVSNRKDPLQQTLIQEFNNDFEELHGQSESDLNL